MNPIRTNILEAMARMIAACQQTAQFDGWRDRYRSPLA